MQADKPKLPLEFSECFLVVESEAESAALRKTISSLSQSKAILSSGFSFVCDRVAFVVSSTFPWKTGIISNSTKVVVSADAKLFNSFKLQQAAVGDDEKEAKSEDQILDEIERRLFSPLLWDPSFGKSEPEISLNARILKKKLYVSNPLDNESVLVIHSNRLLDVGIYDNGTHVLVRSNSNPSKSRICRVHVSDNICTDDSTCWIPPAMFYNLGFLETKEEPGLTIQRLSKNFDARDIPRAKQISVSRVSGPFTSNRKYLEFCLEELGAWFLDRNRLVSVGDVVCIEINDFIVSAKNEFYCDEEFDIRDDISDSHLASFKYLAHFKITDMTATESNDSKPLPSCFVNVDTRIVQSGVVTCAIPKSIHSYYGIPTPAWPLDEVEGETNINEDPQTILTEILSTLFHPYSMNLKLDCSICVNGSHGSGKLSLVQTVADSLGVNTYVVDCFNLNLETSANSAFSLLDFHFEKAAAMEPCVFVMKNVDAVVGGGGVADLKEQTALSGLFVDFIKKKRDAVEGSLVAIVGITADIDKLSKEVQSCFNYNLQLPSASDGLRNTIISELTRNLVLSNDVDQKKLAIQTSGLVPADLVALIARSLSISLDGVSSLLMNHRDARISELDIAYSGLVISNTDFEKALVFTKKTQADTIGAPSIPNVTWDDIGGLAHIRESINDTIQLPLERPELFASGMKKRSGILLFGPPGTGKTLIAKAVATTFSLNFLSVKGPELLNMYIGESEANVRRIFQQARNAKPCVIFFDELDSVAPQRGEKGDSSGGVMDRIVSQLLAELDNVGSGSSGGGDVFVIGATNRPDLLDSALLRPGRFDKMLYLGVSAEKEKQVSVLQALTRKFKLSSDLNLARVADYMPPHLTGADLYALCSDAMLKAISRTIRVVDLKYAEYNESIKTPQKHCAISMTDFLELVVDPEHKSVVVNQDDFMDALGELKPSLTPSDLAHYAHLQDKFK